MILELNSNATDELFLKRHVNEVIKDTVEQSQSRTEIVRSAPSILKSYAAFRKILRAVKRGIPYDEAVALYSSDTCPPDEIETMNNACGHISCNECLKLFIDDYAKGVVYGFEAEVCKNS